ncbi:hypothetical protein [Seonamhaeicola sp.]|uniref:hypothetical protein n=1 Tax=Seonamhaeicola sp. TaxID=1912245 RepID=UPI0026325535|nr:hypothetical protein [Seonamhaeicola sp.]
MPGLRAINKWIGFCLTVFCFLNCVSQSEDLLKHITSKEQLLNTRGLHVDIVTSERVLKITDSPKTKAGRWSWVGIPVTSEQYTWNTAEFVEATIKNEGKDPLKALLWVNSNKGWNSVADTLTIHAGETKTMRCHLRETFPDGTPKLNPNYVYEVQLMFDRPKAEVNASLLNLKTTGKVSEWKRPKGRLDVPEMTHTEPKGGHRVHYQLQNDPNSQLYSVLYLPNHWKKDSETKYPVIVEYPGNIFYVRNCYSTGRPEHCVIGYGMSKGDNAIWISMPFVNYKTGTIAENGWGNPNDTADYTVKTVNEIIEKFHGDRENMVVTGFSRGAIACGFIGLRNDTIAGLWKGMHTCQHYDGDGWGGADKQGAIERLQRLGNIKVFQTDNSTPELKELLSSVDTGVIYMNSGLKAHACDMFLDDRPSTMALRKWFNDLISE